MQPGFPAAAIICNAFSSRSRHSGCAKMPAAGVSASVSGTARFRAVAPRALAARRAPAEIQRRARERPFACFLAPQRFQRPRSANDVSLLFSRRSASSAALANDVSLLFSRRSASSAPPARPPVQDFGGRLGFPLLAAHVLGSKAARGLQAFQPRFDFAACACQSSPCTRFASASIQPEGFKATTARLLRIASRYSNCVGASPA